MLKVFVYGTLKPGESNYQKYCGDRLLSVIPAWVTGQLFALPAGYPALIWDKTEKPVQGYLLTFSTPEVLHELDQLEEYQEHRSPKENAYQRRLIEVFANSADPSSAIETNLGMAWVYVMELEQIQQLGGIFLPQGYWTSGYSKE
jgi:gamma-glutamylcyclotransferase (GGCT)/AIG2-like uncharacterized protein YtfP